ncbi:D-glycero-beta-D-manno-heptose 1-phosphate adenylyltransferase [Pseudonocardia sp.]|uniref:D-glycero-beta-D-manno-heptose 1-phosphate adenylyltransferase n=1 Tax=Pseudonocardia sp. TaxID=60912 RepID=UPI002625BD48|nr:D-glycero-beta-D-manno-heptose 1-phosphate adenylyltransferase [Pseudonocardia sp.]MCW2716685.1 rfaE2 [Pseudonocardia sp.]
MRPLNRADVPVAPPAPAAVAGAVAAAAPRLLVLGDALLDCWLSGPAHRLGRDAPVPVVELTATDTVPGGAANVAANLAAMGARVELLTVLGDDTDAALLRASLVALGVGCGRSPVESGRVTPVKRRLVVGGQTVARYDVAPDHGPRPDTGSALCAALALLLGDASDPVDAVVVSDYGLGSLTPAVRARLAALRERIPLLVVDAHDLAPWAGVRPDVVTPSATEAAAALGGHPPREDRREWARQHRDALTAGGADVLLTLDVDGAVLLPAGSGRVSRRPAAVPVPESRACGAGDTFTAAATLAYCVSADPEVALAVAQAAADVAVSRGGTVVCGTDALTTHLAHADRGRVLAHADVAAAVREHRRAGHRVVFTNGCFDVLHRGHVSYLRQARALGDVLILALNADAGVARLKGPHRPVNPLVDRAGVVGALDGVDLVTSFEEDSPTALLELLRPDVYAKGGDYTPQMLSETPVVERLGGQVRVLDYLSDHSTTAIVDRIRARREEVAR